MTSLEDRLNRNEPHATAALEVYLQESLAGCPPVDRELCAKVERVNGWILYYARLSYPYKCLFNRGLLLRASSGQLSDNDIAKAKPTAETVALNAAEEVLRGRTKKKETTALAEHIKSEMRRMLRIVLRQYEVDIDWRPTIDEPDPEDEDAREDVADYHDNSEDAETRGGSGRRSGTYNDALGYDQDDEESEPLPLREIVFRVRKIQDRVLVRQFKNLMAQSEAAKSVAEWSVQNQERETERRQMETFKHLSEQLVAARHRKAMSAAAVLGAPGANEAGLAAQAWAVLSGPPEKPPIDARRLLAKRILSPVDFQIWSKDGYGSGERHRARLASAGTELSAATYRKRKQQAIRKVEAAIGNPEPMSKRAKTPTKTTKTSA